MIGVTCTRPWDQMIRQLRSRPTLTPRWTLSFLLVRSTDLPWINKAVSKRIRRRNEIYKKEGRSDLWKYWKKITDEMIKQRKINYMNNKKQQLIEKDANRSF